MMTKSQKSNAGSDRESTAEFAKRARLRAYDRAGALARDLKVEVDPLAAFYLRAVADALSDGKDERPPRALELLRTAAKAAEGRYDAHGNAMILKGGAP